MPAALSRHAPASTETVWKGTFRALGSGGFGKPVPVAVLEVRDGDFAAEVKVLLQLCRHPHLVRYRKREPPLNPLPPPPPPHLPEPFLL